MVPVIVPPARGKAAAAISYADFTAIEEPAIKLEVREVESLMPDRVPLVPLLKTTLPVPAKVIEEPD